MKEKSWFMILGPLSQKPLKWFLIIALMLFMGTMIHMNTYAIELNVIGVNKDGSETPVLDYRWLIEKDDTYHVIPGDPNTNWAIDFHRSYMPLAAKGDTTMGTPPTGAVLMPNTHYFVSVLPREQGSYTIGGAPFVTNESGNFADANGVVIPVNVYVNKLPLPTAQITVIVFQDNYPINNILDAPNEQGLEGFNIVLEDAGGRYGMSAGTQMLDAFGYPLGTVYQRDNQTGEFILDADGMPMPVMEKHGKYTYPLVEPLVTGPDGTLTIKNLSPGKYGITAVPPAGTDWVQTSTIEGKKVIDAWVKANEPPFFSEFGPPGYHVSIGFLNPFNALPTLDQTNGVRSVQGRVVNLHLSRPPDTTFYPGGPFPHTTPWIGLNAGLAGGGQGLYAAGTEDGQFVIPDVPVGDYQLVVWDNNLDLIFAFKSLTVTAGDGLLDLGNIPVFQWFSRLENWVFYDINENGQMDADEMGIPEQAINLRWRDGTMYQSFPTDGEGFVPFDEVFPFFSWLVAEVDFARFKATGVTVVVDDGGPILVDGNIPAWSFGGQLNPQPQPENGNMPYRTEIGPVLTEAFQGFLGQTSVMMWGKSNYNYLTGENGGITGVVYYSTTRAEDDPVLGAAEPWEPGIPDVRVNLYDGTGETMINTTITDSWDMSLPEGCPPGGNDPSGLDPFYMDGKCYDGMRNWNQVRPGIFDGGYAFNDYYPDGILTDDSGNPVLDDNGNPMPLVLGQSPQQLAIGMPYVVEVVPPPGYEVVKSHHKNVDFGDNYIPSRLRETGVSDFQPYPICVGEPYMVPEELSLFPGVTHPYYDPESPWYKQDFDPDNPLNNVYLNNCDRKVVYLSNMENAAADFFLMTDVPIAGHIVGFILSDTANEFDPNSPQFSEKYAPPWLPVSIRDWTGREIARTYSDQYGRYNALVPSTYTADRPAPSGMSPNIITTCMNDPILPDGSRDPHFNPQFSTFCYNLQYMPGATTYLDTPVVAVAAFAGPDQFPLDCEFPDGTPKIFRVDGVDGGPYIPAGGGPRSITIESMGMTEVSNPDYCPSTDPYCVANNMVDDNPTIMRDYGFGDTLGEVTIGGTSLSNISWSADQITATVPGNANTGQLTVTRGDNGRSTIVGITVTMGKNNDNVIRVPGPSPAGIFPGAIQQAIDNPNTKDGDLILVPPGEYMEMVIMWKAVKLQGYGAGSTIISAFNTPTEKLQYWRDHVQMLSENNQITLLPGQEVAFGGIEPGTFFTEEGAGIFVIGNMNTFKAKDMTRIDGFTITGASTGGGIVVNGYSDYLQISNTNIANNSGFFGGGIRIGHPQLTNPDVTPIIYTDARNDFIRIHHNHIKENGGQGGAGGGISLCTGSDSYEVSYNWICGNFTMGEGGGIGHIGLSTREKKSDPLPVIKDNHIIFNESFNQGTTVNGGGIFIGGAASLTLGGISPGSGSVKVTGNLIQGNSSGAGDGAGIRLDRINGQEVADNPDTPAEWYSVDIFNNMIVNNVAALAGGAISMQDALRSRIIHNTIANNDSTATAGEAFAPGSPNMSTPQPAGIVSHAHNPELAAVLPAGEDSFSNPELADDIILHNRSFYYSTTGGLLPDLAGGDPPVYDDLAVLGAAGYLDPNYCFLTNRGEENPGPDYSATNVDEANDGADPAFMQPYFNGSRGTTVIIPEATTIQAPAALDEGGNFIQLRYGPLGLCYDASPGDGAPGICSDYHINSGSNAIDAGTDLTGTYPELSSDFDGETRPSGAGVDIGADEYMQVMLALNTATTGLQASTSTTLRSYAPLSLWPQTYAIGSSLSAFSLTSDLSGQTLLRERSVYQTGLNQINLTGSNQGAIGSLRLSSIFSGRPFFDIGLSRVNSTGLYPNTFDWQKPSLTSSFSWSTQFPVSSKYSTGFGRFNFPDIFSNSLLSSKITYPGLQNSPNLHEIF